MSPFVNWFCIELIQVLFAAVEYVMIVTALSQTSKIQGGDSIHEEVGTMNGQNRGSALPVMGKAQLRFSAQGDFVVYSLKTTFHLLNCSGMSVAYCKQNLVQEATVQYIN